MLGTKPNRAGRTNDRAFFGEVPSSSFSRPGLADLGRAEAEGGCRARRDQWSRAGPDECRRKHELFSHGLGGFQCADHEFSTKLLYGESLAGPRLVFLAAQ